MFQFFTEDQKMLQTVVREFVEQKIAPHAAEWDAEDKCPVELWPELGQMGMLGCFVPQQYGGVGLGLTERAIIIEEVSRYSAGLGIAIMTHDLGVAAILNWGTEEQKQKYLPELCAGTKVGGLSATEPTGGSDLGNQGTTIDKTDTGFVVNGRKCFITNSHIANVNVIIGCSGVNEKGRKILSAVIVPPETPGLAPGREEHKLGLKGSVTGEVILNDVKIGDDCLLSKVGDGMKVAMHTIGHFGRSGMAAIATGVLKACLEDGIKFAKERVIYGKPMTALQAIQFLIADNKVEYEAAENMLFNATAIYDRGTECVPDVAAAKLYASEAAIRAAKRTIELMGGYGVINEYAAGRYMRDALAIVPSGGTSEIMKIIIAGGLTR